LGVGKEAIMATTVTALAQQSRNAGTYRSPGWLVPTDIAVTGEVSLIVNVLLADLQDVRNTITLKLEKSDNNSVWRDVAGSTWVGGNYLDRFGNVLRGPGVGINISDHIGKYLRLTITTNRRMTLGIDLDIWQ
jgi:hypothetical protein